MPSGPGEIARRFNTSLRRRVANWLSERKAQLEKNTSLAAALDIPIGPKPLAVTCSRSGAEATADSREAGVRSFDSRNARAAYLR